MSIREYIGRKKERFKQYQEQRSASQALSRQKEIVMRQQRLKSLREEKLEKDSIAALRAEERELRTPSFLKGGFMQGSSPAVGNNLKAPPGASGIAKKAQSQVGRPTLYGNPNSGIGSDYRGPDFTSPVVRPANFGSTGPKTVGGITKKKGGYDPFGYRGIQ